MKPDRPDQFAELPSSLVEIAETLGLRVALALVQNFGGLEVKFPKNPGADHPVLKALGESDGRAVCSLLGGGALYVPRAAGVGRWRRVQDLAENGVDRSQIARLLGLSVRHVRRLANGGPRRTDRDSRQISMFDDED